MTKFTTSAAGLVELHLGKPIGAIIGEANSEDGLSLRTLTALSAGLQYRAGFKGMPLEVHRIQFDNAIGRAAEDIDKRGAAAVGAEVGKALGEFIETVLAERA